MRFKKFVKDGRSNVSRIDASEAGCVDCAKIIEKYDGLDPCEQRFDAGLRTESQYDEEYEEHMRTFHRMVR